MPSKYYPQLNEIIKLVSEIEVNFISCAYTKGTAVG